MVKSGRKERNQYIMGMNLFELDGVQEEIDQPVERNLMIVDGLNLSFRYKHRGQTDFGADYLKTVRSLAKSYQCVDTIITSDFKGSTFRKEIHPGYKAGRKEKFKDQTDEEKEQNAAFFQGFEECLELLRQAFPVLKFEGVEADDLAGYLVKELSPYYDNIWLISTDKDWNLLLKDNVHRFSYVTRREYTLENFYEEMGCDNPEEMITSQCLQGQTKDSIPGVKGIGVKKAYNILRQYGDTLDIVDQLPLPGKQKFIQELNASGEMLEMNLRLMDILTFCEAAINHPAPDNTVLIDEIIYELRNR